MSNINQNFLNDFNQLKQDAEAFNQMVEQEKKAAEAYKTEFEKLFAGSKDPEVIFAKLMYLIANQGFDQLNGTLGIEGESLKVQGDLTKLGNDINGLTTSDSTDPQAVCDAAQDTSLMLDTLSSTPLVNNAHTWYSYVRDAVGSFGADSLYKNYATFRGMIYDPNDPYASDNSSGNYNPTPVTPTPGDQTYYFDPTNSNSNYLHTFSGMEYWMKQPGDQYGANEASKMMNDAFNANTATTNSVQAASNQKITLQSNTIKTIQSFLTDMMHSMADTVKAVIQNFGRQ